MTTKNLHHKCFRRKSFPPTSEFLPWESHFPSLLHQFLSQWGNISQSEIPFRGDLETFSVQIVYQTAKNTPLQYLSHFLPRRLPLFRTECEEVGGIPENFSFVLKCPIEPSCRRSILHRAPSVTSSFLGSRVSCHQLTYWTFVYPLSLFTRIPVPFIDGNLII